MFTQSSFEAAIQEAKKTEPEAAIRSFQQLIASNPAKDTLALLYHEMGVSYYRRGDLEQALIVTDSAIFYRREINDLLLGRSLFNAAFFNKRLGFENRAIQYYQEVIKDGRDTIKVADSYRQIGNHYKNQGDYESALSYFGFSIRSLKK